MKKIKGFLIIVMMGLLFAGCTNKIYNSEMTVGNEIKDSEIEKFYLTYDSSTDPPEFLRYYFYKDTDKWVFHYEKREGDHWPLTEDDVTDFCDVDLTAQQEEEFFNYINNGKVTQREDSADAGGRGPWLFIYWDRDKGEYQVYSFESYQKQKDFESFCKNLIR